MGEHVAIVRARPREATWAACGPSWDVWHKRDRDARHAILAARSEARCQKLAAAWLRDGAAGVERAEPNCRSVFTYAEIAEICRLIALVLDADGKAPEVAGQAALDAHAALEAHSFRAHARAEAWPALCAQRAETLRRRRSEAERVRYGASPWYGMPGPVG